MFAFPFSDICFQTNYELLGSFSPLHILQQETVQPFPLWDGHPVWLRELKYSPAEKWGMKGMTFRGPICLSVSMDLGLLQEDLVESTYIFIFIQ